MDVLSVEIAPSPERKGFSRLAAQVGYDDGRSASESYWYEVPERFESSLSRSGNPWVAALLPLAVKLGEPLRIPLPVDDLLMDNARELMRVWRCWYPSLHEIEVEAPLLNSAVRASTGRTATLFSAGVDAFFTLLSHTTGSSPDGRPMARAPVIVDDLLCVWGLDIALSAPGEFDRLATEGERLAFELGKEFIPVATNLMSTRLRQAGWGTLYHGSLLAGIGVALEGRLGTLLVPSSHTYAHLNPWGSHPLTDPLLSTRSLSIRHDGAGFTRVAKTRFVSQFDAPRRSLRVCWNTGGYANCGKCPKCIRTMTTLYLLGVLAEFPTFPGDRYDVKRLRRLWSRDWSDRSFWVELRELAREVGRRDVARQIEAGLMMSPVLNTIDRVLEGARRQRPVSLIWHPILRPLIGLFLKTLVYDDPPA